MSYPLLAHETVDPNATFALPFRPAAAGLINVIVRVVGLQPTIGNGNGDGNGGDGHPPSTHFRSFTVAVRLDLLKPGQEAPVATSWQFENIVSPTQRNRLVLAVHAPSGESELGADWTVRLTNTKQNDARARFVLARAVCDTTVRYQVQAGNLGKVDHIVVLMMENRSFDHMLGFLSLEEGRAEVDGLVGGEFNYDRDGNRIEMHPRSAPSPDLTDTWFLTDPGHGWQDVVDQLAGDAPDDPPPGGPKLASNAGFVRNFQHQLDVDTQELPPQLVTLHEDAQLAAGETHLLRFRPGGPGPLSATAKHTQGSLQSETGVPSRWLLELLRPGLATPLASFQTAPGPAPLQLGHPVSADELAPAGDWTLRLSNLAENDGTFSIDLTFPAAAHDTRGQEPPAAVMSYYNRTQLPVYHLLAERFAICDQWYASLPTDTWPNRLYALAGRSAGLLETPSTSGVEVAPPGYDLRTIFEVLEEQAVDWGVFFSDLPFALVFEKLAQDARYTRRMRTVDDLLECAQTGELPAFAWVDPNFSDVHDNRSLDSDDHPPGDVCRGQRLVAQLYNALSASPAWPKTLLIITYDEHGGFYDHWLPPGHPMPDATKVPDEDGQHLMGLRVPTFLVSPWVTPRSVSKTLYDHTSLLSTVLRRFCSDGAGGVLAGCRMGQRADAANDVGETLAAQEPELAPQPAPIIDCTATEPVAAVLDRNSFGAALHTALFGF